MKKIGTKRITTDKFYTNKEQAKICWDKCKKFISHKEQDYLVIEPSAGNGVFLPYISPRPFLAFDIIPEGGNILQKDFLQVDLDAFQKKLYFVGNPPFGRQSSLAKKFIKHITKCVQTEMVAFILPKSFKKASFQKTFPLSFHLVESWDIPENSFHIDNKIHNVPCVFQIWKKRDKWRKIVCPPTSKFFFFVKKEDFPHFSLRRVGVYAGKLDKECASKSSQSHYFIKLNKNINWALFETKYNTIHFPHNNTVGPKSICKSEFISAINSLSL